MKITILSSYLKINFHKSIIQLNTAKLHYKFLIRLDQIFRAKNWFATSTSLNQPNYLRVTLVWTFDSESFFRRNGNLWNKQFHRCLPEHGKLEIRHVTGKRSVATYAPYLCDINFVLPFPR